MEKYPEALIPGTVIRGTEYVYTIEKVLGQGTFGITYRASTTMKGRLGKAKVRVALKEFFVEELDSRNRDGGVMLRTENSIAHKYAKAFQRESENLSRMDHPGIVHVLEAFEANGTYYYSMEYLAGGSLDDKVKGTGIPEKEALNLIVRIADALSYMHDRKMMHLDLKPKNIVLQEDGTPVIIDFGLSKQYDKEGRPESSTTIGGGTPGYAPVEQGEVVPGRTFQPTLDIYALGGTLFKMLTGKTPPTASLILNKIASLASELHTSHVSASTISAVCKTMSPLMGDRPQSVADFLKLFSFERDEETLYADKHSSDAKMGDASALCRLGDSFFYGRGVAQDYSEAVKWYRKAADQGNARAQNILGECYYYGRGIAQNYSEAVKWYRKAADQNYSFAQYNMGYCYGNGQGTAQDYSEAVKWYRKAADQNHAAAQNNLGDCYYYGRGVAQDYSEAVKWYRKAVDQGYAVAQCNLGYCYENGKGVAQDYSEAVKWYRKAADQGNARAQNNLGECYYYGRGIAQDYSEAVKWYRKAADQNYSFAQYNMGYCYGNGQGTAQDYSEAVKWYRKAADQNHAAAQYNLGYCYKNGNGVAPDYSEAVKWYRKAADQGNARAQNCLGSCYYNGEGIAQDYSEALKWYRKAADQGNSYGQRNLGVLYEFGWGVTQDYEEARRWYLKAKEKGYPSIQDDLDRLAKKM